MTAQNGADDSFSIAGNSTQSGISFEKLPDRLAIISLGDIETLHAIPQLNRGVVVPDAEFAGLNLHGAEILARLIHSPRGRRLYFFAFRGSSVGLT
jgi:hypothetical protein